MGVDPDYGIAALARSCPNLTRFDMPNNDSLKYADLQTLFMHFKVLRAVDLSFYHNLEPALFECLGKHCS